MNASELRNWGDAVNPILFKLITGNLPQCIDVKQALKCKNFLCVGSILRYADQYSTIWGTGFINEFDVVKEIPQKVCAVRGPLTKNILDKIGIECPEIYGDPALLFPKFYSPPRQKKYKLGIVKHWIDQDVHLGYETQKDVLEINILNGIHPVVDAICSCESIASSSLHGLILADAYEIPSCWIKLTNRLFGGDFKFKDYWASIGKIRACLEGKPQIEEILSNMEEPKTTDLNLLWDACPFKPRKIYI